MRTFRTINLLVLAAVLTVFSGCSDEDGAPLPKDNEGEKPLPVVAWDGKSMTPLTPSGENTYDINYASEWVWLAEEVAQKRIKTNGLVINIKNDLDFGEHEMRPFGYKKDEGDNELPGGQNFWGKLYGNGHTVKNLKITEGRYVNAGFINQLNPYAEVHDLVVECTIVGNVENTNGMARSIGGIAGTVIGGQIKNCVVKGEISTAARGTYMGGVVGYLLGGRLENCVNYAKVTTGANVNNVIGGVAATISEYVDDNYNFKSFVLACGNHGDISSLGNGRAGGIAGEGAMGQSVQISLAGCYNVGKVTGYTPAGIIIIPNGASVATEVFGCYNGGVIESNADLEAYTGVFDNDNAVCGAGVFGFAETSDDVPASVGMSSDAEHCGKKTAADLNSSNVIDAMNLAIVSFNNKQAEDANTCNYRYQKGETYPTLKLQ